jgi:hypothetical protein
VVVSSGLNHPRYGHTPDFSALTGELYRWGQSWRLRYAPLDEEDQYGGAVLLEGLPDTSPLREGQHVQVHGTLIPPLNRGDTVRFSTQSIDLYE